MGSWAGRVNMSFWADWHPLAKYFDCLMAAVFDISKTLESSPLPTVTWIKSSLSGGLESHVSLLM
jgi:hypothetical protein